MYYSLQASDVLLIYHRNMEIYVRVSHCQPDAVHVAACKRVNSKSYVRACVYVTQISQTRCGRTVDRMAFILGTFETSTPLV